jgi:hypothetical protein
MHPRIHPIPQYDVAQGHADCGEFGGWPYLAMQYVIDAGGLRSDAVMPYCAGIGYGQEGYCIPCMPEGYSKALCGDYDDDDQVAREVCSCGPS